MFNQERTIRTDRRPTKQQTASRRGWSAGALVLLALVLAGCSSASPTAGMPAPTSTPFSESVITPSVSVTAQEIMEDKVVIAEVVSDGPGWLVIHAQKEGKPGPVLGYSSVADGTSADVMVELDLAGTTETLYTMLHTDAGTVGTYEFPGDDAPVQQDGTIVMAPFSLQVTEGEAKVTMVDFSFDPPVLVVRAGTAVTWTNHDGARHNTESDHGVWESALFGKDGSYSITFDEPGIYPYHCQPHGGPDGEGMSGTVVVISA